MANATVVRPKEYGHMCAMSLARGKTDCSINAQIDGMTYCFGNEDAKTTFMKDPHGNLAKAWACQRQLRP
jgi:YHS domain-containing protein